MEEILRLGIDPSAAVTGAQRFERAADGVKRSADGASKGTDGLSEAMKRLSAVVSAALLARQAQEAVLLGARYETLGSGDEAHRPQD